MARRKPLDVSFGAKRYSLDDTLDVGLPSEARRRTGKRDLSVKVPRNAAGTISAPEKNIVQSGVDALSRGLSVFGGGDERAQVQRASDIANALGYGTDMFSGAERAGRHAADQLWGSGQPVTTQDYINLVTPAAAELLGAGVSRLARTAPAQRFASWLGETKPRLVDPDYIEGRFRVVPRGPAAAAPEPFAVQPSLTGRAVPMRIEGAAPTPALPAPGPGLPPHAVKPRGGQWWPDTTASEFDKNISPEMAATKESWAAMVYADPDAPQIAGDYSRWLEKALTRYLKNDFGTPDDPLRGLAEKGLHYDPHMTPEDWSGAAKELIRVHPIGRFTLPGADENAASVLRDAPWLAKQPVTDKLYSIDDNRMLGLDHMHDRMIAALSGTLPSELSVNPSSLERMSFPQAVEHVGKINQHEAAQAAKAAANEAVAIHKTYPDDPRGMHWVEIRTPELPEGWQQQGRDIIAPWGERMHAGSERDPRGSILQDALSFEGRAMQHCAGDYCPDVLSGRTRVFSLRDANMQPHATIETSDRGSADGLYARTDQAMRELGIRGDWQNLTDAQQNAINLRVQELSGLPDIVQIKGKQNQAPVDKYLPYIQDFVKTGNWGNVGEAGNADLVKLPDGRYITTSQARQGLAAQAADAKPYFQVPDMVEPDALSLLPDEAWQQIAPYFKGYAYGGRVSPYRCFTRNPLAVR